MVLLLQEVHAIRTRARERRPRSQRALGGILPLPHCGVLEALPTIQDPALGARRPPRYACQRRRRIILRTQQVNTLVDCINRLACAAAADGPIGHVAPSHFSATASQSECVATLPARVRRSGLPPSDLSPTAALQELLQAKDLYSQEPQHLASYDPSLLKIFALKHSLGMPSHYFQPLRQRSFQGRQLWHSTARSLKRWVPATRCQSPIGTPPCVGRQFARTFCSDSPRSGCW